MGGRKEGRWKKEEEKAGVAWGRENRRMRWGKGKYVGVERIWEKQQEGMLKDSGREKWKEEVKNL